MQEQEQKERILLTISEVSAYLSIKQKTLYAKVEAGEIPHYRIGHLIRFRIAEIDAWLEGCRKTKAQDGPVPKKRKRTASGKGKGSFDKIVAKVIDQETTKYYSLDYGKSDRIEGPKEVNNGSL